MAYAVVIAHTNASASEYGHLVGVTQNIQNQRDEIKGKFEALKKTVRQLNKLNLDDEGDQPNDGNAQNNSTSKGKKRKK